FSPDGRWLIGRDSDKRILTWRTGTWERGIRLEGGALSFAPDSRLLAVETGDARIRLLEPATGRELGVLVDPHQDLASAMTFTPAGRKLITASWRANHALHVWDLPLLRQQLAALGLDWKQDAYPPAPRRPAPLPRLTVDHGRLPLDPEPGLVLYSLAIA